MVKINKPNLKFSGSLQPINKNNVDKLVQHHMAHKSWDIYDVHNYHKNGNGWNGIGYNYWIGFDGTIYEGRGFNIGAHVKGHNSHTLGIGYQGDFTKQTMPDAQLKAGIALNKWLIGQLPNANKNDIIGHRDLANTSCPGKNFRMKELINGVGGKSVKPSKKPASKPSKPKGGNSVVRAIQTKLNRYKVNNINVDGLKGPATKKALIKAYQYELNRQFNAGLAVDGLPGPKTDNAAVIIRYNKKYGNLAHLVQAMLYLQGISLSVDGYWQDGSIKALKSYQSKNGLTADGLLGKATSRKLTRL